MIFKMFSIRDAKGEKYYTPFFKNTHGEAERDFIQTVKDPQTTLNKFPEDFDLYFLGEYDDAKGVFMSLDTPQHLMKAVSVER